MKRETTPLVKPLSISSCNNQNNPVYVKLLYLILLLSLTIFLYSTFSIDHSSSSPFQTPKSIDLLVSNANNGSPSSSRTSIANNSQEIDLLVSNANNGSQSSSPSPSLSKEVSKQEAKPKCDLFKGDWVPNPNGSTYNNTCRFTEFFLNCQKNGRPDNGYQFWRWKPKECELPGFDPDKFLNLMRNKGFAFIGDSILRNQMKSLLCLLSQTWPELSQLLREHLRFSITNDKGRLGRDENQRTVREAEEFAVEDKRSRRESMPKTGSKLTSTT